MTVLQNKLESIFKHIYLWTRSLARNNERRETKRSRSNRIVPSSFGKEKKINSMEFCKICPPKFLSDQRINPSKKNFLNPNPWITKTLFRRLSPFLRNRCTRRNQSCSKQVVPFSFFLFLPPRLVRTILTHGRLSILDPLPLSLLYPREGYLARRWGVTISRALVSLVKCRGSGEEAKRIKAGAGSGAIIQSSGQLGSIVLIAFHGGRCRQESILSLGLTLSMLHTMSFIINVTGTFRSEGSSTTAEISNPSCSNPGLIDIGRRFGN